jgi:endonuclease-3
MKPESVKRFFATLKAKNPEPKSELEYTNPYTLLVAVVLSAQATDIGRQQGHQRNSSKK